MLFWVSWAHLALSVLENGVVMHPPIFYKKNEPFAVSAAKPALPTQNLTGGFGHGYRLLYHTPRQNSRTMVADTRFHGL
jgi:hypothetical protein